MPAYNPPTNESYCQTNAFDNISDNLKLIGPKGHNFIRLTIKLDIKYLWWDKEKNIIEMWGGKQQIINAQKYMKKYLPRFHKRHCIQYLKILKRPCEEDQNTNNFKKMKI